MGIAFTKTFGNIDTQSSSANGRKEDRPKAQYWLNIGYYSEIVVEAEDGGESKIVSRFVSLNKGGVPLDTLETLKTNQRDKVQAAFSSACNDLRDQLLDACKNLAPGGEKLIGEVGGLQFQLRRVNEELTTEEASTGNPFVRKLALVG